MESELSWQAVLGTRILDVSCSSARYTLRQECKCLRHSTFDSPQKRLSLSAVLRHLSQKEASVTLYRQTIEPRSVLSIFSSITSILASSSFPYAVSLPQPELTYSTSSPVFFASLAASNDSNRSIFSRLRERISRNAKRIVDLTIVLTTPRPYSLLAWKPLRGKSAFRRRVPTEVLRAKLESRQRKRERGWSRGEGEGTEEG